MLVKNWMSKNVITIKVDTSMQEATALMKNHRIRMLPVVKKNKLVGIITDRDLKRASASDATSLEIHELLYILTKIKVKKIMTKDPIAVPMDWTVEETARLLLTNKISGAPVVDEKESVVGVITQTDLFRVLVSLTGINAGGIQFAFKVSDKPGSIKEIADIIREFGGQMVSILSSYDKVPEGFRMVYIRMRHVERSRLEALQKKLREKAPLVHLIDQRENRREFFPEN
jgi:acetoin utilization protein AcuB